MAASSDGPTQEELDQLFEAKEEAGHEYNRLYYEVKELERRVAVAEEGEEKKKMDKDLTFKRANKEFAYAKLNKAAWLYDQRKSEKERAHLITSGQQHRVPDVDGAIKSFKEDVKRWEDEIQQRKQQLLEVEQEEDTSRAYHVQTKFKIHKKWSW